MFHRGAFPRRKTARRTGRQGPLGEREKVSPGTTPYSKWSPSASIWKRRGSPFGLETRVSERDSVHIVCQGRDIRRRFRTRCVARSTCSDREEEVSEGVFEPFIAGRDRRGFVFKDASIQSALEKTWPIAKETSSGIDVAVPDGKERECLKNKTSPGWAVAEFIQSLSLPSPPAPATFKLLNRKFLHSSLLEWGTEHSKTKASSIFNAVQSEPGRAQPLLYPSISITIFGEEQNLSVRSKFCGFLG